MASHHITTIHITMMHWPITTTHHRIVGGCSEEGVVAHRTKMVSVKSHNFWRPSFAEQVLCLQFQKEKALLCLPALEITLLLEYCTLRQVCASRSALDSLFTLYNMYRRSRDQTPDPQITLTNKK